MCELSVISPGLSVPHGTGANLYRLLTTLRSQRLTNCGVYVPDRGQQATAMTDFAIKQHLTVKNIFIAIVALNIFSTVSTTQLGGTFQDTAKPIVRTVPPIAKAPSAGPPLIAHMVPDEAVAPATEPAVAPLRPPMAKPPTEAKPHPRKVSGNSPSVSWMMLLTIGAMALYARYLAARMAQNAVEHAVGSVKQIYGALAGLSARPRAPAKPVHAARPPPTQAPPKVKAAQPRKSTVVRASRWPFAA
jgi:hypothetical protein